MMSLTSGEAAEKTIATSEVTIRDWRRNGMVAPGGPHFENLVRRWLPMVEGAARELVPELPDSVRNVCLAVFESFAHRMRRVPRKTVIPAWLLRTAWLASLRERRRLRLPALAHGSRAASIHQTLGRLFRFSSRLSDLLVLDLFCAEAPQLQSARNRKRISKGWRELERKLKKNVTIPPRELLRQMALPPDSVPASEETVLAAARSWHSRPSKSELARQTLASWRWINLRLTLRRIAAVFCAIVVTLVLLAGTFAWLAHNGYLTSFFIRQGGRDILKDFPELAEPAKPWPVTDEDRRLVSTSLPKSSAALYGFTNIWLATLRFSEEEWGKIGPKSITPVRGMRQPDGRLALVNPEAKRNGLLGAVGLEFDWVAAGITFGGEPFENVAIRYRGNGTYLNSLHGSKQSFKVDLNKFTKKQSIAGINTLNFLNSVPDDSYIRDTLAERLFRDLGVPAPRTAYAYVTRSIEGQPDLPLGLYVMMENLDKDYAEDRFGSRKVPIFKPVTYELFQDLGEDWGAYARTYDLKTDATPEQLSRVIEFARLVTHADDGEFARRLPEFLDMDQFSAFVAGHVLLSSYDGFLANGQNYYMYLDPGTGRFGFISWDQDHSWGEFGYVGTAEQRDNASIWHPSSYDNRFLERVMKVEAFRAAYRKKLEFAIEKVFTVERLYPQVDALAALLRPAVAAENSFRLRRFDEVTSGQWGDASRDGAPEGPRSPIRNIKRFIANRAESVRAQLEGRSDGMRLHRRH